MQGPGLLCEVGVGAGRGPIYLCVLMGLEGPLMDLGWDTGSSARDPGEDRPPPTPEPPARRTETRESAYRGPEPRIDYKENAAVAELLTNYCRSRSKRTPPHPQGRAPCGTQEAGQGLARDGGPGLVLAPPSQACWGPASPWDRGHSHILQSQRQLSWALKARSRGALQELPYTQTVVSAGARENGGLPHSAKASLGAWL